MMISHGPPEWMTANPILTWILIGIILTLITICFNLFLRTLIYGLRLLIYKIISMILLGITSFIGICVREIRRFISISELND